MISHHLPSSPIISHHLPSSPIISHHLPLISPHLAMVLRQHLLLKDQQQSLDALHAVSGNLSGHVSGDEGRLGGDDGRLSGHVSGEAPPPLGPIRSDPIRSDPPFGGPPPPPPRRTDPIRSDSPGGSVAASPPPSPKRRPGAAFVNPNGDLNLELALSHLRRDLEVRARLTNLSPGARPISPELGQSPLSSSSRKTVTRSPPHPPLPGTAGL